MSNEADGLGNFRRPAPGPYPVEPAPPPVLQPQMPVGFSQPAPVSAPQPVLQPQMPVGFSQPAMGYQQPIPVTYNMQQPAGPIQQPSHMTYMQQTAGPMQQPMMPGAGYPGPGQMNQGYAPVFQQQTSIRQPVSVAFGAPLIHPGVPKQQYIVYHAPPAMPQAPPPYPGPPLSQEELKYSMLPDAPDNLYGKK